MVKKIKSYLKAKIQRLRFYLSSVNHPFFLGYYKYVYKPKEGSLSAFLHEYSRSKRDGFFVVQIGANDGITHDPIHKFIKRDHWSGVLLEPQSFVHDHYLEKIYERNQGIQTICAAIGPEDGTQKLYKIGFSNMRWATGLASFQKENLEKAFSSGKVKAQCERYQISMPDESQHIIAEDVEVVSPETLKKKYSIDTIDLLQIDAEGYDFEVIKIFKIDQFHPKAIVFEHTHLSDKDKLSCVSHLKNNHYQVTTFGPNMMAMLHPDEQFSKYFRK